METFWVLLIEISQHFTQNYLWVYAALRYLDEDIYVYGKYIKQKPLLYQKVFFPPLYFCRNISAELHSFNFWSFNTGECSCVRSYCSRSHLRIFLLRTSPIRDRISKGSIGRALHYKEILPSICCLSLEQTQLYHSLSYCIIRSRFFFQCNLFNIVLSGGCVCVKSTHSWLSSFQDLVSIFMTISAYCFYVNQRVVCLALLYLRSQARFKPLFCYVWKANF